MWPSARRAASVVVLACLAAMSSVTSAQSTDALAPDEEMSLQQIRDFVGATAQRYRMISPLVVSVASWVGNPSLPQFASSPAVKSGNQLYLNRRLLRASNRDVVIATASPTRCFAGRGRRPRSPTGRASARR
jgi:hypothetical protein